MLRTKNYIVGDSTIISYAQLRQIKHARILLKYAMARTLLKSDKLESFRKKIAPNMRGDLFSSNVNCFRLDSAFRNVGWNNQASPVEIMFQEDDSERITEIYKPEIFLFQTPPGAVKLFIDLV